MKSISRKNWLFLLGMATVVSLATTTARAADFEPVQIAETPAIQGSITLYGWYTFFDGDIDIDGVGSVDVGDGSSNLFDILDGFFFANGEIRYGEFGVYGDIIYAEFSDQISGPPSRGWEFDGIVFTGTLSYEIANSPEGWLQVLVGARYWSVDSGVNILALSANRKNDWVDFVGGLRGRYDLSPSVFVEGTGLLGTGGSDFMWDVSAGLGYQFTEYFSGSLGYRGMGVDYSSGPASLDITFQGPVAGLTLRF